jgi:hypothetical protein
MNKNIAKIGLKIIFPKGDNKEIGNPQLTKIGKEISERKSCNWKTFNILYFNLLNNDVFIIF